MQTDELLIIATLKDKTTRQEVTEISCLKKIEKKENVTSLARGKMSVLLKDDKWRGSNVHAGRDWYPVHFGMDWVRYCEGEWEWF